MGRGGYWTRIWKRVKGFDCSLHFGFHIPFKGPWVPSMACNLKSVYGMEQVGLKWLRSNCMARQKRDALVRTFSFTFEGPVPHLLVVHLGGNDLGPLKGKAVVIKVREDLSILKWHWQGFRYFDWQWCLTFLGKGLLIHVQILDDGLQGV